MAEIMFKTPEICSNCGAHNFKISGVIYNGEHNYTKLVIKCMKCGTPSDTIKTTNK